VSQSSASETDGDDECDDDRHQIWSPMSYHQYLRMLLMIRTSREMMTATAMEMKPRTMMTKMARFHQLRTMRTRQR
jgi:hypothetical protein